MHKFFIDCAKANVAPHGIYAGLRAVKKGCGIDAYKDDTSGKRMFMNIDIPDDIWGAININVSNSAAICLQCGATYPCKCADDTFRPDQWLAMRDDILLRPLPKTTTSMPATKANMYYCTPNRDFTDVYTIMGTDGSADGLGLTKVGDIDGETMAKRICTLLNNDEHRMMLNANMRAWCGDNKPVPTIAQSYREYIREVTGKNPQYKGANTGQENKTSPKGMPGGDFQ
jgi:hypothetical protein